ncbi:hypothetical protein [Lentzea albidocapillata]|uniref:FtsX-like permease family protein n=1 Tax=Lentzea albidocapillata TaxID=40571 RepID=A0A1W2FD69_9PSEU|nr:hypothetical protein [Lentzea albidocapillata]SMD19959.1 hypothetical protein SAMN05660733_05755 [Lentzea albidocapillata]
MTRQLRSRLLGIGRAAGTRSESGGIRFFALALASLLLALSAAAVIAAPSIEASRANRMSAGQLVRADTPAASTVLVKMAIDHLQEGRQYTVVFLSPVGDGAPLPPGLDAWPARGTAVVSPELLREGAGQRVSGRYGEIAGTIGAAGLADATELLAYVRPAQDVDPNDNNAVAVSGFGGSDPVMPRENLHWLLADQDLLPGGLVALLVVLGLVPSLLLALVASGVAAHSRDRRDALVTALGGRVPHRLWIAVGEAWVPVSLGAAGAVAVIAWFTAADRRLPIVDYVVSAADIRGLWWAFALCAVAAAAFVLCVAVLRSAFSAFSRSGNRTLRELAGRTHRARVVLFPCFVLLAAWGPSLFSSQQLLHVLTGYAGLVGAVLTMPAAIGVGVAAMGRALASAGRDRQQPALLTSGRRMAFRPEATARQVFGVCACIFFLLFALTMQSNFASNAGEANSFIKEHGYSLVEVHPRGQVTSAEVDEFVAAVPDGIEVVAYTRPATEPTAPIRLTGTCPALTALTLPCSAEQQALRVDPAEDALAAWLRSSGDGRKPALTTGLGAPSSALAEGSISLLAFTFNGDDIAAGVLNNAGAVFPYGAATSVPGESWYIGAVPPLEQSGWITLIGGFGLAVLILATGLGLAGEFLRFGRSIAPLSVLTGNRRIYWRAAALVSLLPLTTAVAGGFLVGYVVVRPMARTSVNLITPTFVAICCGAALFAGIVVWSWSAAAAVSSADRWRPGRGDD